jgi:hypothetical protein
MKKLVIAALITAMLVAGKTPKINAQVVAVYPSGNPSQDLLNVQNAVNQGGVVRLKATDEDGVPKAFDFGLYDPGNPMDMLGVIIEKAVAVKGEKVDGSMTTIHNGYLLFSVGWENAPDGPVVIQGIHFDEPGFLSILVHKTNEKVTIRDNRITADLWNTFKDVQEPDPYSPESSQTWTKLFFDTEFQEWHKVGIWVGPPYLGTIPSPYGPPGSVDGEVLVENNYIDFAQGDLPTSHTRVWWHTFDLIGAATNAKVVFRKNTIRNSTARGIMFADPLDTVIIDRNQVELGNLGSYELGLNISAFGILAVYGSLDNPTFPEVAGSVHILNNRVTCGSRDKIGIVAEGYEGKSLSHVNIINNVVDVTDGLAGIGIIDIANSLVVRNCIRGSAYWGITVGYPDPYTWPLATSQNILAGINVSDFESRVGVDVWLGPDAVGNLVICRTGTVEDNGTDNRIID